MSDHSGASYSDVWDDKGGDVSIDDYWSIDTDDFDLLSNEAGSRAPLGASLDFLGGPESSEHSLDNPFLESFQNDATPSPLEAAAATPHVPTIRLTSRMT